MISVISDPTQTQPVGQATGTSAQKPTQSDSQPATTSTDSVQLSKAAQGVLAALQEARETPTQTAKEANHGDLQARKLLAKEAAAQPVIK